MEWFEDGEAGYSLHECGCCGAEIVTGLGNERFCPDCGWDYRRKFEGAQDFLYHVRKYRHEHKISHPKYRPTGGHR